MENYLLSEIREREEKYKSIMQTRMENQRAELNSMNQKDRYYFMKYIGEIYIRRNNTENQIQIERNLIDYINKTF